ACGNVALQAPMLRGMVAKFRVGKNGSGHHIRSRVKSSTCERASDQASCGHKSITTSPSGCEQQISTLPSAGASIGSGRYLTVPPTRLVSQVWQTPVRQDHRV